MLEYTPVEQIPKIHATLRQGFRSGKLRPIEYRKQQVAQLAYMLDDNIERFEDALLADLGKSKFEATFMETAFCKSTIINTLKSLEKWAAPSKPAFDLNFYAMSPKTRHEPKGVVLIISPFNFPLSLTLPDIASALAAGNAVLLKPSEQNVKTSALFAELLPKYLDPEIFAVVNGDIPQTSALLELQWDHIFFIGSGKVGRIVSLAAAKHLTPVTLELGGKCPVVIDGTADLKLAARRVLWGKAVNAGQACIAPDYVLIVKEKEEEFIQALKDIHEEFYPTATGGVHLSPDIARLVNDRQFQRAKNFLEKTNGKIVLGGGMDAEKLFMAPTVVKGVSADDILMSEEIFAPILPILTVANVDEAIAFITGRDHPLALYMFSNDTVTQNKIIDNTKSGACLVNEIFFHAGLDKVPFGGVGASGHGSHGGYHGFKTFSHERTFMSSPGWLDSKFLLGLRYPPYSEGSAAAAKRLMGANASIPYPRNGEAVGWFSWIRSRL